MTVQWITPAGRISIVTERVTLEIPLEATSPAGPVEYSLIAGNLPRGLRLDRGVIKGSPTEVRRYTVSRFVIRASAGLDIEDRTFSIDVDGSDAPVWITREGFLNVGEGENFFVLDNAKVDFQLEAFDSDVIAGDELEYYLIASGGELPPGLSLSRDGRIFGFTDPIFTVEVDTPGGYDTSAYDISYLDKAEARSNGFDSFFYDTFTYDYNEPSRQPRRLSRYYTFVVAVSDGVNEVRRLFRIWVVTDEFLKSDNSIVQVDTNLFRADNTSNRVPIWITESNLGIYRANNYLTVFLDVYDPPTLSGSIIYLLVSNNPDGSVSELPPGMTLDTTTGNIAGRVPYQSRVSKTYTFTLQAVDFPISLANVNYTLQGNWSNSLTYLVNQAVRYNGIIYICVQENRNQLPDAVDSLFWQSTVATSEKTFTIEIIGEIDSAIDWISDNDLGTIKPNQPSTKSVVASSLLRGGRVVYEQVGGTLPPGLTLLGTGDIVGKVKQFGDNQGPGLTRFFDKFITVKDLSGNFNDRDVIVGSVSGAVAQVTRFDDIAGRIYYDFVDYPSSAEFKPEEIISGNNGTAVVEENSRFQDVSFDNNETSTDKLFKFKVQARDTANFAALIREFSIKVVEDNSKIFADVFVKAFQKKEKRLDWFNFITDGEIFVPSELYRYGDENFGLQTEIKVLIYAGVESVEAVKYVQAMSRNHYRKQLKFGDVKFAVAKDPNTQEILYEVVYAEIVDDLQRGNRSIASTIELPDNINSRVLISYDSIKIDSDIPLVSDRDHQRIFPNSIKNMRRRIKAVGERDRSFLPLWMRSIQDREFVESGYLAANVLCYTKPGFAEKIIARIKSKTVFASRGVWDSKNIYRLGDSVSFAGETWTSISTENQGKNPQTNPNFWIKNFNFKLIDFTVDRYLIDTLNRQLETKYLAFPQRDILNKLSNPSHTIDTTFTVTVSSFDNDLAFFDNDSITFDQE
jgi:hypothetical protein